MKLIFLLVDKHESFLWFFMGNDQAFPKYQLQNLRKNEKNKVGFLHADKNQRFLQMDTIILGVCG